MKITDRNCKDGKRHSWRYLTSEQTGGMEYHEFKWCKKCGSYTEFINNIRIKELGSYYIEIPSLE